MPLAVVTGASSGIGLAIARRLLGEYQVLGISRTPAPGIPTYLADVGVPGQVAAAWGLLAREHGPPDVLVNCAGAVEPQGILEVTPAAWERQVAVNLSGTFYCCQEFTRLAHGGTGGVIVNIASTAGTRPSPGWAAYAAAKAGVVNLSLTLAEELRPWGIRVHCVAPGRCATALRRQLAPDEDPAGIMQPAEVAELVHDLIARGHLLASQVLIARR